MRFPPDELLEAFCCLDPELIPRVASYEDNLAGSFEEHVKHVSIHGVEALAILTAMKPKSSHYSTTTTTTTTTIRLQLGLQLCLAPHLACTPLCLTPCL